MIYKEIEYEIQDKEIARIRLNAPSRMNSFNLQMWGEFIDAVQRVQKNNLIRVLIVSGNGRAWCVGGDLTSNVEEGTHLIKSMDCEKPRIEETEMLRSLRVPTIAQVNGYVMADGFGIMNAFDLIVAAEGAKIGLYANKFGGPAAEQFGWLWMMPIRKVKEMVFTGGLFDAEELYRVGLINKVVPLDKLEEETTILAKKIADMNPLTMRLQKESIRLMLDTAGFSAAEKAACLYHWIGHYAVQNFSEEMHEKRIQLGMQWFITASRAGAFRDAETIQKVIEDSIKEYKRQGGKFTDLAKLEKVVKKAIKSVKDAPDWNGPAVR